MIKWLKKIFKSRMAWSPNSEHPNPENIKPRPNRIPKPNQAPAPRQINIITKNGGFKVIADFKVVIDEATDKLTWFGSGSGDREYYYLESIILDPSTFEEGTVITIKEPLE